MLSVRFDYLDLENVLKNTIKYSEGFFQGIEIEKLEFNKRLGGFIAEALGKYIDAKARSNPESLHHVYEWNNVGNPSARLFSFSVKATKNLIILNGKFKSSKSVSSTSKEPFENKATVMENAITVTIEPKESDFLVFDYEGQTIFTKNTITVENPGGAAVQGSFQRTVDNFFNNFLTSSLLKPYIIDLATADEFTDSFYSVKSSRARYSGVRAGRRYMEISGMVIE